MIFFSAGSHFDGAFAIIIAHLSSDVVSFHFQTLQVNWKEVLRLDEPANLFLW